MIFIYFLTKNFDYNQFNKVTAFGFESLFLFQNDFEAVKQVQQSSYDEAARWLFKSS